MGMRAQVKIEDTGVYLYTHWGSETLVDVVKDTIKRIRAKIQNDLKEFLPTDASVAKKRGWQEDEWRKFLGYPVAGVDNQTL